MRVAEIWRYPVKSLAGEPLAATELTTTGIPGDRVVRVRDHRDMILTARTHPRLLGLRATLGSDGQPRVNVAPVDGTRGRRRHPRGSCTDHRRQEAPRAVCDDDVDPDTLEHDPSVLRRVVREMEGRLGLDCYVIQGGRLAVGDRVMLLAPEGAREETPASP